MGRSTRRQMWMGARGYEQWVPAPKTSADFSSIGVLQQDQYLNGGSGIRGSKDSHKEYNMAWSSARREELAPVLATASGIYDDEQSPDLVYFVDPTVYDWNVLPAMLAAPYKTGADGVPLTFDADGYPFYPDIDPGSANAFGYPARAATYRLTPGMSDRRTYIPIPPGKTFWIGVHGQNGGAGISVTPFNGAAAYPTVYPTPLDVTTDQRVNTSWSAADGITGVEIGIGLTAGNSTGWTTVQGIIGQMLDDGAQPFPGGFIPGEGNSGCEFASTPTMSPYLGGRLWTVAAKLVETGSWR